MTELEEFGNRLMSELNAMPDGYVSIPRITGAIQQALHPATVSAEFPLMLYLHGDRNQTRTVQSAEEEAAAVGEGFTRMPSPQYAEGFPKWFVERPVSEGGWKVWDNRRVTILAPEEEAQFHSAIEENDWIPDTVDNRFGARGFGLSDLIAERKAQLKAMIDQEPLAPATEEPAPDDAAQ